MTPLHSGCVIKMNNTCLHTLTQSLYKGGSVNIALKQIIDEMVNRKPLTTILITKEFQTFVVSWAFQMSVSGASPRQRAHFTKLLALTGNDQVRETCLWLDSKQWSWNYMVSILNTYATRMTQAYFYSSKSILILFTCHVYIQFRAKTSDLLVNKWTYY